MVAVADRDQGSPKVRIVVPDAGWAAICSAEIEAIRSAIAPARMFVDHVGSTAVPGLDGKPVIDLLVTLIDWDDESAAAAALGTMGYKEEGTNSGTSFRYFYRLSPGGSVDAIHLHLTPLDSAYGQDMVVFRDSLMADAELGQRYVSLKRQLATDHPDDVDAYTSGKSEFVSRVLRAASGAFGNDRLLTHQRAELNKAQRYQSFALASQLGVAVVAATSVYSNDNGIQLNLAILGFLLAFVWLSLARKQRSHRSAGDQARRVVLMASGLGERFSAEQRLRIFDKFTVPILGIPMMRDEAYFASRAAPGYRRLAELIEESAYWTRDLQQASATILQTALTAMGMLMALALWIGIPMLPSDVTISMTRALLAILVFMISTDLVGAIFAHREAASTIGEILQRTETAAARGYPTGDVLLIMSDYNAAVESAPLALPGVFALRRASLTRRWRSYLENKRL